MDVKKAVETAKECIGEVFEGESILSPRLEEIVFDESQFAWKVTISFIRQSSALMEALSGKRTYKVVQLDDQTGDVVSVTHRSFRSSD